jgi:hypothetical protein
MQGTFPQWGALRLEIDRGALRHLLLSSLPPGMVHWNAKVIGIDKVGDRYELTFADGKVVTTAVLIGADGAWSKVRPLVSGTSPAYAGVSSVELHYRDADQKYPTAAALVGKGMMFALSDQRGLIGHREPNSALCVHAALKVPETWSEQPVSRTMLRQHFADWHQDFHELIAKSDSDPLPRPIFALPVGRSALRRRSFEIGIGPLARAQYLRSNSSAIMLQGGKKCSEVYCWLRLSRHLPVVLLSRRKLARARRSARTARRSQARQRRPS